MSVTADSVAICEKCIPLLEQEGILLPQPANHFSGLIRKRFTIQSTSPDYS